MAFDWAEYWKDKVPEEIIKQIEERAAAKVAGKTNRWQKGESYRAEVIELRNLLVKMYAEKEKVMEENEVLKAKIAELEAKGAGEEAK